MTSRRLTAAYIQLIQTIPAEPSVRRAWLDRVQHGRLTRDEDAENHLCVYFAGYDAVNRQVFLGHHKKSGLWLFNGGHVDIGELPSETMKREAGEEWGKHIQLEQVYTPSLIAITQVQESAKQRCRTHYDVWYFVPLDKQTFKPDDALLATEFFEIGWKTIAEARNLVTDTNTLTALVEIERMFQPQ